MNALKPLVWRLFLWLYTANLVNAGYRGVLGREPDAEGFTAYAEWLIRSGNLAGFLADLVRSDEFQQKSFTVLAPDLVRAAYRGLLGRDADPEGLAAHVANLTNPGDLAGVLADIVHSEEFTEFRALCPNPADTYDTPCRVFIHIPKTAGTSIQNMLRDSYGHELVYGVHADTLHQHSPEELSKYSVFAGHFNYDSLSNIPGKALSIFTFVREPKKRLISLYHFWCAHEPSHANYHWAMNLANQLTIEPFFEDEQIRRMPEVWNNMTYYVMGQRQLQAWQGLLAEADNQAAATEIIDSTIRPAIRRRLREFIFIGLQEDFERSAKVLFHILQRPQPEAIRMDNTLEWGMNTDPHFKKTVAMQSITSRLDAALDRLVQLDNIVYKEASRLYSERSLEYSGVRIWDTTAEDRVGVMHAQMPRSRLSTRNRPKVDALTAKSKNTGMTREDVIQAFRIVLGRHPESEETIRHHLGFPNVEALGQALLRSEECRNNLHRMASWPESKWVCTPVLDGLMMWVDLHDRYVSYGCLRDMWEPNETAFVTAVLRPGDCFVDCGANIGWFTLLAAQLSGPSGLVIAFEPRADIFTMLQRSVTLNGFTERCHLHCLALGNSAGQVELRVDTASDNPGGTYLKPAGEDADIPGPTIQHHLVTMRTLDEFIPDRLVRLIKLDVEGAEPGIIAGAVKLLTRDYPIILSEIFDQQLKTVSGVGTTDYFRMLGRFGYVPFEIIDGRLGSQVSEQNAARPDPYNLVFIHPERHRNLLAGIRR